MNGLLLNTTMKKVLVSGLINIETTLRVDSFPLTYEPVRFPFFGINSTVSGVGYNISKALTTLGDDVDFLSIIGQDFAAQSVRHTLLQDRISGDYVIGTMPTTAQSVIIYERSGQRQIHTDLKDIQEQEYPYTLFEEALQDCSMAVLCNINFNRPFLERVVQENIPIATDVHTISDLEDSYNQDFMAAANILFLSDERLPCTLEYFAGKLQKRYGTEIVVIGLGNQGALLAIRENNLMQRYPAVKTRPIVNTIGAGDALFSAFLHTYLHTGDPETALKRAILFASYKIGTSGAADGFLTAEELIKLHRDISGDDKA